ncbi:MAG: hypothetical protein ACRC37_05645, partial [Lentisphaeria bacterium]
MNQVPYPGTHCLVFRGDVFQVKLILDEKLIGKAYFRTTLGRGEYVRADIIEEVETSRSTRGQAWHDIEMSRRDERTFEINLAILEVGHFEGKCLFFEEGKEEPLWVQGANIEINAQPAEYCVDNTLYCAF